MNRAVPGLRPAPAAAAAPESEDTAAAAAAAAAAGAQFVRSICNDVSGTLLQDVSGISALTRDLDMALGDFSESESVSDSDARSGSESESESGEES